MNSKYSKCGALTGLTSALLATSATAATIVTDELVNVDFDGSGGIGASPSPRTFDGNLASTTATGDSVNWVDNIAGNDVWNGTPDATSGNINGLLDSTGAATSVNVTWSGFNFTYNNYGNNRIGNSLTNGPNGDGFNTGAGTATVTISGLMNNGLYSLTVIGGFDETDITVGGDTRTLATWNSTTNPSNWTVYENISASPTGEITFTVGGPSNDQVGGFQITAVPEPTSLTLLGIGAISLVFRRKR